jgi:hypothetical protein
MMKKSVQVQIHFEKRQFNLKLATHYTRFELYRAVEAALVNIGIMLPESWDLLPQDTAMILMPGTNWEQYELFNNCSFELVRHVSD